MSGPVRQVVVLDSSPYGNAADARSDALLADVVRSRGVAATVVAAERLVWDASGGVPGVPGLGAGTAVLLRADLRTHQDLCAFAALARAVERTGATCFPGPDGILAAEDKLTTAERLTSAGIPTLRTLAVRAHANVGADSPAHVAALVESSIGFPCVVKHCVGWGGMGMRRCGDAGDLATALDVTAHDRPGEVVLVQPLVHHARTLTVLVAGDRAVASYAMRVADGEFRSNSRHGGRPESWDAPPAVADLAVRAVASCGLPFGSVDLLDTGGHGLICAEVNSMPGLWPDDPDDRALAEAIVDRVLGRA